ncbi:hypothetical protein CE91St49_23710 [Emergencia timonensis]|nr:hypothetical protein CE91St48_23770 [Emergencia timonensis]BDF13024.1 hypothetical protein CE91St49_23710 [Emergencia timonensis]
MYLVSQDKDFQSIASAVKRETYADFQLRKIENVLQGYSKYPRDYEPAGHISIAVGGV